MSDWIDTHGGEYAVPEDVVDLLKRGVLEDISYGNIGGNHAIGGGRGQSRP